MGLSRLDNFLKSLRGTILYVDPNSLDSTDSVENSGNSLTRPFKTIQRALIEAARFSYQRGQENDRFNKTTILLYPGDHIVDNRPGYIPTSSGKYSKRNGETEVTDLTQWDLDTVFDLSTPGNPLFKLNSIHGGVIVPRGTSIVGMDLRKTKIRPTYVPDPENDNIERSCVFRVTGACYFWQFTLLDADPNGNCYKNYNPDLFVPNFSHHKLSGFEYADGLNPVDINDDFLTYSTTRTDLDMYYEKVAAVYGPSSGKEIVPDYGDGVIDIQPTIDEYRIVGSKGASVGISSIRAGGGTTLTATTTITVDLAEPLDGVSVDTPIKISGVSAGGYDGQYVVRTVNSTNTQITYQVQSIPTNLNPTPTGATLDLVVDTVTSASPYIFNCSLRSVYGMCGLLADGDKATGFKSMVVAQYTGIGLQKDDNAFAIYNETSGEYQYSTDNINNLHTNSKARFRPSYENFHIKATNDAFLQLVSVFAIGYANHFVVESGGDIALNNSNSNFGAKALVASGFKRTAFNQDNRGYITHIIPPKEIESKETTIEFYPIDVAVTNQRAAGAASTDRLYLYDETNQDNPPKVVVNGYHVGAKVNESLNVQVYQSGITTVYSSRVVMPYGPNSTTESSSEKVFTVQRSAQGVNRINVDGANIITLTQSHSFINGESVRIISDNGSLPDGLETNKIYYAVINQTDGNPLPSNQIKIAKTLNDANNNNSIIINDRGGVLSIVSRVSDKNPGDIGHPVQWDGANWYVRVALANNRIYDAVKTLGTAGLGEATPRTYVTRIQDDRNLIDTLYRVRYVLPKDDPNQARPPLEGFILQESSDILGSGSSEISQLYNTSGSISKSTYLRNPNFIAGATWSSNVATITSELPHNLRVGDEVKIVNVVPSVYNGSYIVTSLPTSKSFTYSLPLNSSPVNFANNTSARDISLPYFVRERYNKTYQIYKVQTVQEYVQNLQDGIYYLTLVNCSNKPTVTPFREQSFSQSIENLYPQKNLDNPDSDPDSAISYALSDPIGEVIVNEPQNSVTKETLESFAIGLGITNIRSSSGTAHTIYTAVDHGLSGITSVSIVNGGLNYGEGVPGDFYNAQLVGFAGSTTGSNATAKISINASGTITSIKIIDGGSAYGIGNTLRVVGVATTNGFVSGVVRVASVSNNINDTIEVIGVSSAIYSGYNTIYRVSGVTVGRPKQINVISASTISSTTSTGIGLTLTSSARYIPTGKALLISSFTYSATTGLATVGFTTSHGFRVDNKIRIRGANQNFFNGDFIVKKLNSSIANSSVIVDVGIGTTATSTTGTLYAYRPFLSSYGGELTNTTENSSGRLIYNYAGITTTLGASFFTATNLSGTGTINIPNAVSLGFNLGDYILINNEIFRIREAVTSNNIRVHRGILGSPRQTHLAGSVVRRIKVTPVELRRNSIIRASGHTFEYLGFGPGNYSTSLPEKQDRTLGYKERLLAQASRTDGGVVVYTGMNSDGDFFSGNKKINSTTGKEETYDTPIPTQTGEKDIDTLVNITDAQKLFVENSLQVDGGKDKNSVSKFYGPVIFNNKVTAQSDIESNSILIQGDEKVSRKFSISNQKPDFAGNYGDIEFNSIPKGGQNAGWIYTIENEWKPFGWINNGVDLYGVGISSGTGPVGFSTLVNFVGSGITITRSYDSTSGVSTLTFSGNPITTIGISSAGSSVGDANRLNFVSTNGVFNLNVSARVSSGIATISIGSTVSTLNFRTNVLGKDAPRFISTSVGTRIIYENTISNSQTNYATGIGNDTLWSAIPQNNSSYTFRWYGGETEIVRLGGDGALAIYGESTVTAGQFISTVTTGTSPITVGSSTLVSNLNANYLNGFVSAATTTPNTIVRRDSSNNINGNASHLIHNVSGPQRGEWYADIPARLGYFPFNRAGDVCSGIATFNGDANFNGLTTIKKVSDIYINRSTLGTTLNCDFNDGPITRTTSTNVSIININNVPTTDSRALNYTVLMNAAAAVSNLANIQFQINGVALNTNGNSIRWLNNLPPAGTSAGYYFFGFSIFRVGTVWEVIAVFATYS